MIKLLVEYGVDLDAVTPKNWTPLSYCKAKGKYGATEEKGIYPEVCAQTGGCVWEQAGTWRHPCAPLNMGSGGHGWSQLVRG